MIMINMIMIMIMINMLLRKNLTSEYFTARLVLSLHYNESNSFIFANATKIYQFNAKDCEIKD